MAKSTFSFEATKFRVEKRSRKLKEKYKKIEKVN